MAVSSQDIVNFLLANPGMSDAQIVSAMEQYGVSPAQMASAVGLDEGVVAARVAAVIPPNQSIQLGDTIVQPVYSQTGSGMDAQIGPIENVITYKADENKVGGGYTQYTPTGEVERTGTQQEVNAGKDFLKFAAGAGALFGAPYLMDALGGGSVAGTAGGTAFDVANAGIAGGASAFTPAQLAAIEAGTAGGVTSGGLLTGAVAPTATSALTTAAPAATTATTGLLSTVPTSVSDLATKVATNVGTGLLTKSLADTVSGVAGTAGNLLQSQTSKEAANTAAQNITNATNAGVAASQFRPVGMTTRFGTSNYTYDPTTGQMTSAGYQLSPEAKAAQDRLVGLAGRGLTQAEQAQQQFAPLQQGATNLFNLGNQYIQQSPEQVAQDYINKQMALLAPSRETSLANLANTLSSKGTTGLSIAQGGTLKAANPVAQAFANAQAMQDLQLAANAQQAGQQNVTFGAGLLGQGANAMGQYYGGQASAYQPYTTALGQIQSLESAGQQPLNMGASLGQQSAQAGANAGRLGQLGAQAAGNILTGNAAIYNPYAGLLTAAGNPNSMFGQSVAQWLNGPNTTNTGVAGNPLAVGEYANPGYWT